MCFLSSLYGISDGLTDESKFYLALLGQVIHSNTYLVTCRIADNRCEISVCCMCCMYLN